MSGGPENNVSGPGAHRDFLPLGSNGRGELQPMPWCRLSPADCLLLAIALHRSAQAGRETASSARNCFPAIRYDEGMEFPRILA
jgi:hypothetical protein